MGTLVAIFRCSLGDRYRDAVIVAVQVEYCLGAREQQVICVNIDGSLVQGGSFMNSASSQFLRYVNLVDCLALPAAFHHFKLRTGW